MVFTIYFLHWFLLITQWISNACNACIVFYMLNLFPIVIYLYNLDFLLIHSNFEWQHIEGHPHVYNALLFVVHDSQLFKIHFYYKRNEMQNLGYHFCQISQNVTPIFNQQYHLLELTYAYFIVIFFHDVIFKDSKRTILLLQKCISIQKTFSSYKIYLFVHHNLEKPYFHRLVNLSCHGLYLLPISKASIGYASNILSWIGFHWWVVEFIGTHCGLWCRCASHVFRPSISLEWGRMLSKSFSKSVTASFMCGGEVSSSSGLLRM